MCGKMKLNGNIYLSQEEIINELEDLIILLEEGSYCIIAESIKDIKVETAENCAKMLADFQDMFRAYCKLERYCKLDLVLQMTNDNLYDNKKEKVSIFTQGAYGVTIRSDEEAAKKYVFNTCLYVFMKNIKKFRGKLDF
jgi:uncharacterized protein with NAD-binding domain and iron-sulfur cluster